MDLRGDLVKKRMYSEMSSEAAGGHISLPVSKKLYFSALSSGVVPPAQLKGVSALPQPPPRAAWPTHIL